MAKRTKGEAKVTLPGLGQMSIWPEGIHRIEVELEGGDREVFARGKDGWRSVWGMAEGRRESSSYGRAKDRVIASTLNKWTQTHPGVYHRLILERLDSQIMFGDFASNYDDLSRIGGGIDPGDVALADVAPFLSLVTARMLKDRIEATRELYCTIRGVGADQYQRALTAVMTAAGELSKLSA